jgi:hypothetical protein
MGPAQALQRRFVSPADLHRHANDHMEANGIISNSRRGTMIRELRGVQACSLETVSATKRRNHPKPARHSRSPEILGPHCMYPLNRPPDLLIGGFAKSIVHRHIATTPIILFWGFAF